jgi:CelD/BcsL family acetyltransferase involved in cellulose biosynthesis
MNSEASEYCAFLLHPGEPTEEVWRAIRNHLSGGNRIDALRLPHVRRDGSLHALLAGAPASLVTIVQPAPAVRASDYTGPDSYAADLPTSTRAALRRKLRKLRERGSPEFVELSEAGDRAATLSWILTHKREWMRRHGVRNDRLFSRTNVRFLQATLEHDWRVGSRRIFALKLDGAIIAAELVSVDERRVESFLSTFDAAFGKYSPGRLLNFEVIRWALAKGLDYDFRPGTEAYKLSMSNHVVSVDSYVVPPSFRGHLFVRYRMARRWLSARTPVSLRRAISRAAS